MHRHAVERDDGEQRASRAPADRPTRRGRSRRSSAPTAGAARRTPSPAGPTSSTSFANTGSSATAPPNSTANRSSEIAPNSTGVRRTSRTPPSTLARSGELAADPVPAGAQREHGDAAPRARTPTRRDVDELRLDREEQPAERRAADHRQLERDRALRERADEDLPRHERRRHRAARRGARAPTRPRCRTRARRTATSRRRPTCVTARSPTATAASSADRDREHGAPRVPVGEVTGREREQRQRHEHREPDEPEVERVAVDRVDLPADRDERHLDRERRRHGRDDVEREVAMPKRRAPSAILITSSPREMRTLACQAASACRPPRPGRGGTRPRAAGSASRSSRAR